MTESLLLSTDSTKASSSVGLWAKYISVCRATDARPGLHVARAAGVGTRVSRKMDNTDSFHGLRGSARYPLRCFSSKNTKNSRNTSALLRESSFLLASTEREACPDVEQNHGDQHLGTREKAPGCHRHESSHQSAPQYHKIPWYAVPAS